MSGIKYETIKLRLLSMTVSWRLVLASRTSLQVSESQSLISSSAINAGTYFFEDLLMALVGGFITTLLLFVVISALLKWTYLYTKEHLLTSTNFKT